MDDPEDVGTFAGRVATFARPHHFNKRRASAASKKKAQTTVTWPHETPTPEDLAKAGFFYKPSQANQDSVTCFLCGKALDGWDADDDPAIEHLSHVPDCGWAINACIERRSQDMDRAEEDPLSEHMMESRRATFRDMWPHEGKRGWKCKLQKMVEAGWCYNPLPEADDCVQCFYCGCSLDGWEPKDDPLEEHRKRAPDCPFFSLVEDSKAQKKTSKGAKGRRSRASKASRASTQSNVTATFEEPPLDLDDSLPADDDTILTTTSTSSRTTKGRKKAAKGKAAPKKAQEADSQQVTLADDSIVSDLETNKKTAPKPKSTRAPRKVVEEVETALEPRDPPRKTRGGRKKEAPILDDDKPRAVSQEENGSVKLDIASPSAAIQQPKTRSKPQRESTGDLSTEFESTDVQKTSRGQATRKASRAKVPKAILEPVVESTDIQNSELVLADQASQTRGKKRTSDGLEKTDSSITFVGGVPPVAKSKTKTAAPKKGVAASRATKSNVVQESPIASALTSKSGNNSSAEQLDKSVSLGKGHSSTEADLENNSTGAPESTQEQHAGGDATTRPPPTPPKEALNQSATGSPQSSDAENHPPSSRPSLLIAPRTNESPEFQRLPLKPTTPRASPSKRIIDGGLNTKVPWTAVDLEHIFLTSPSSRPSGDENKENLTVENIVARLTLAEKKMKVEEWILWNAAKAEEGLKGECERLIGAFEGEGIRALRALEGIEAV